MGGLFSSPSSPPAPEPVKKVDPGEEERKRRLENIERRRRGRVGTIETSARGVLDPPQTQAPDDTLKEKLGD